MKLQLGKRTVFSMAMLAVAGGFGIILPPPALIAGEAPAASFARFKDGLLADVRPKGWLEKVCRTQAEGLTGHPEALSYPYDTCLWAGSIPRKGNHGAPWWRYEQTAYYTDGLLRLGYTLGDAALIAKGEAGVDWTLDHAAPGGQLGDACLWDRARYSIDKGCEMWPMAVFFRAMKAKYDATHDERIPATLAKYYLAHGVGTLAEGRNTINVEGMTWCYGLTGDRRLLDLAEKAWAAKKQRDGWSGDLTPGNCASDEAIYMHGVSYSEELKIPLLLHAYTGRGEYLRQAVNAEAKLVRDHMLPDGCPSSTEQTRGNSVHWGHETCVIADYTWSLGYFLETTGDARYADRIERCVFNAGLGAVTDDFKALQYFSNLNQFIATSGSNHNPYHYGTTWTQYRPTHETECCAGNVHRILPNYVSRMWLKDADGAPVAALYGPSEVDFGWAKIAEETRYPFDGKIAYRFSVAEPRESAFTYRVPGWCKDGATVRVNDEPVAAGKPGEFATIRRVFRDGDTIELDFPMRTEFEVLPRRHYVIKDAVSGWSGKIEGRSASQGTVVNRGPLLFAFPIAGDWTEDTAEHAIMRGKKSANADFKCWNMRPAGPFNYALAAHEAKTVIDGESVCVEVPVRRIEWNLEQDRFTPDIPEAPKPVSDEVETIRLVPYGATTLRLAVFPDLGGPQFIAAAKAAPREESLVQVESTFDGTLQPCRFWVPEEAATNSVPLIVCLHTWSNDYKTDIHYAIVLDYARKHGWAMAGPNFRGPNNTFDACGGEAAVQDIVDAVNYAKAHVKIDPARVYIVGASGGGHMALVMLGRHPEIFAAGAAFCPISDLARWHADSLLPHPGRGRQYAGMLELSCGGKPSECPEEYALRSPLSWLGRARRAGVGVYIATGIHDGWKGSVPVGHSFRAFNALAKAEDRVDEADIAFLEKHRRVPEALAYNGPADPFYPEKMRIHFRRTSGNVRFTLMEGAHTGNFPAGLDFLSRQAKGRPADFTLPSEGEGRAEELGK